MLHYLVNNVRMTCIHLLKIASYGKSFNLLFGETANIKQASKYSKAETTDFSYFLMANLQISRKLSCIVKLFTTVM